MSEYITHPTDENLRIQVEQDPYPEKPYHDGGFPIWRIERSGRNGYGVPVAVQETDITGYVTPSELDEALGRMYASDWSSPQIERYLRIFWGATFAQWWHSGSYWYVTADPAHWREHVDVTDADTQREGYTEHAFTEWQAWVEGDVWFAVEQRRVFERTNTRTWDPAMAQNPADPSSSDEIDDVTTDGYVWQDTDNACGGFYGDVDAEMAKVMGWQFGWPEAACKHCGEGIVNDVTYGWVDADVPFTEREQRTHCVTGVMMHTRGPRHEPKEK